MNEAMAEEERVFGEGPPEHRVEITFDDGITARLICPEEGCKPAVQCGQCGRNVEDEESKPCYDCKDGFGDGCWLEGWFDNLTPDELLHGKVEVPISAEWDGDHPIIHIEKPDLVIDATTPRYELDVSEFDPKPGSTIVLTLPVQTHGEVFEAAQEFLREKYPENKIIVMHADAFLEEKPDE